MDDAIIISDIHLGSEVSQSKKLIKFFEEIESGSRLVKSLIINGDLFDSWDFRKLKKNHWKVLSHIRKLSKILHIVYVNGNHDGPAEIISHLLGVEFLEEYILESGGKKILVLHGDKFDKFIADYPILTRLADNIYRLIQKIDKSFYLARMAKKNSKTFLRCSELIREKAKKYGEQKKVHMVCCSHTHLGLEDNEGKIGYYNSGCWTEEPCTFLTIKDGIIKLNSFVQKEHI
jgi:UDP-2,3-diacylglucosamine pyrophosphatase LpxH